MPRCIRGWGRVRVRGPGRVLVTKPHGVSFSTGSKVVPTQNRIDATRPCPLVPCFYQGRRARNYLIYLSWLAVLPSVTTPNPLRWESRVGGKDRRFSIGNEQNGTELAAQNWDSLKIQSSALREEFPVFSRYSRQALSNSPGFWALLSAARTS